MTSLYSGCPGVTWRAPSNQWQARIKIGKKETYLGIRRNVDDAIALREQAEAQYWPEDKPNDDEEREKIKAVIRILKRKEGEIEAADVPGGKTSLWNARVYDQWYTLGKAVRLLSEILDNEK